MTRQISRAQRREAFMQAAEEMIDRLEGWYDAHPDASLPNQALTFAPLCGMIMLKALTNI